MRCSKISEADICQGRYGSNKMMRTSARYGRPASDFCPSDSSSYNAWNSFGVCSATSFISNEADYKSQSEFMQDYLRNGKNSWLFSPNQDSDIYKYFEWPAIETSISFRKIFRLKNYHV